LLKTASCFKLNTFQGRAVHRTTGFTSKELATLWSKVMFSRLVRFMTLAVAIGLSDASMGWVQEFSQEEHQRVQQAQSLYRKGKYEEAARSFERLLPAVEKVYGKDSTNTAVILHELALQYKSMGQYARAEPLYQRSLAIAEAKLGKHHPNVALPLHNLANLYA
jgi:tetratricopeptide (TPR) repeat protein